MKESYLSPNFLPLSTASGRRPTLPPVPSQVDLVLLAMFANGDKLGAGSAFMPTRNVNLTEHLDHFIETGVTSGRFSNASEVVREGLRLLEQREREDQAKIEWLRAAAKEGFDDIERGEFVTLRSGQEIDDFVDQVRREVSEKLATAKARG